MVQQAIPNKTRKDRWLLWLTMSLLLNGGCLFLFPMFVTDGLTLCLTLILGVPSAWNFYALFCYRTPLERLVGHLSVTPTLIWLLGIFDLAGLGWAG